MFHKFEKSIVTVVLCGIVMTAGWTAKPAWAQLLMEQSRVKHTVKPGETIVDQITIHNTSDQALDITVYWEDFIYTAPFRGKKQFMPAGTSPSSMSTWISFSPLEVTLPPKSKQDIRYTLQVPSEAFGGFNGVLFFEQGAQRKSNYTGVSIVTRLGSLFFVETVNKDKSSSLDNVRMENGRITGTIANQGNVILFPRGTYYILDKEGIVAGRGEVEKLYLPPNEKADFAIAVEDELPAGSYTFVLTFDLEDGDTLVKEIDFQESPGGGRKILNVRD